MAATLLFLCALGLGLLPTPGERGSQPSVAGHGSGERGGGSHNGQGGGHRRELERANMEDVARTFAQVHRGYASVVGKYQRIAERLLSAKHVPDFLSSFVAQVHSAERELRKANRRERGQTTKCCTGNRPPSVIRWSQHRPPAQPEPCDASRQESTAQVLFNACGSNFRDWRHLAALPRAGFCNNFNIITMIKTTRCSDSCWLY